METVALGIWDSIMHHPVPWETIAVILGNYRREDGTGYCDSRGRPAVSADPVGIHAQKLRSRS